jgi:glycosyltransferase involved in cell wall biosynthesis
MKIAIYDPYLDALGGGEKYMLTAAEYLSQKHAVTILWNSTEDVERVEERFGLDLSKAAIADNLFSPQVSFFARFKKSREYDVIFYLSDGSIPLVGSKKLVLHLQFPIEWVNVDVKTKLKLQRVQKIIVNSQFTKKFIDKKLGVKSVVVYPPVTIKKIDKIKENLILHVGRFMKTGVEGSDYKKQYFMIESFKKLVDAGLRNWKFVIAASVRSTDLVDFQKMQSTAAGYPISFILNATNDELWSSYSAAKIYWHASGYGEDLDAHPERAEHFGISTVEAMGAGAVPVVINAGGQREIITDEQDGLLWNTQEELLKKTTTLIENDKKRQSMQKAASHTAQKYSIEQFGTSISQNVL